MLTDLRIHYLATPEQRRQAEHLDRRAFTTPFDWSSIASANGHSIIAKVAEVGRGCVVGFILMRITRTRTEILRLAVDPVWRRRGVASMLLADAIDRAATSERQCVIAMLGEEDRASLELFKACGFGRSWLIRQSDGGDLVGMSCDLRMPVAAVGKGVRA